MIKLVETIQPNSSFVYPGGSGKHQSYSGISILAPLPNQASLQFESDPLTYPVEVIQGLKCNFNGFTIRNNDPTDTITLTVYLQTNPQEFLPRSNEIQNQVSINQTPSAAFSAYYPLTGTSSNTTPVLLTFDNLYNEVDLLITGSNAMISFKLNNELYGEYFKLLPGYYAYSISLLGIKFYATDTSTAEPSTTVQVMGLR